MDALTEPDDDFAAQVAQAQRELREGIMRAGLQRDAYRYPIMAYSVALGVLPAFVEEIRQTQQVEAVFSDRQVGELGNRLAQELPGAIDRLTWQRWILSSVIAGVVVVAVACSGYFIGKSDGKTAGEERAVYLEGALNRTLSRVEANNWLALIQNNNELDKVPHQCAPSPADGGRERCVFTLWGGPSPPPTEQQAAANVPGTTKPPATGRKP
jgi:hypothetical protein